MKILVIDNSALRLNDNHYYCQCNTGAFSKELSSLGNEISWFQQVRRGLPHVGNFDITYHKMKVYSYLRKRCKIYSYVVGLFVGFKAILDNDFVYMFYPNNYWFILTLCILLRKPYGIYIRGMVGINSPRSAFLYRHAKVILTVSNAFTEQIKKVAPKTTVETIRPMVDIDEHDKYERAFTQVPLNFNISFLARIDRDKGLYELLNAVKALKNKPLPKFVLNIYGDGQDSEWLKILIKQLGVVDSVNFRGAVKGKDNLLNVYRSADIYVLPTYHEGFPRTLYEAMISGTPIVTTMVGGIPGLMRDNVNCLAIETHSVESIVEKLTFLLNSYSTVAPRIVNEAYKTVLPVINSSRPSHAYLLHSYIKNIC